MGLIHSRASKKRAKAEAELLKEQTRQLKDERREAEREQARERRGQPLAAAHRQRRHPRGRSQRPGVKLPQEVDYWRRRQ